MDVCLLILKQHLRNDVANDFVIMVLMLVSNKVPSNKLATAIFSNFPEEIERSLQTI